MHNLSECIKVTVKLVWFCMSLDTCICRNREIQSHASPDKSFNTWIKLTGDITEEKKSGNRDYHIFDIYSLLLCQEDIVPETSFEGAICYSVQCFA